jgi:cation diffusion facilitator family transporter
MATPDFNLGIRLTRVSIFIFILIGSIEIVIGLFVSDSLSVVADGIDSLFNSFVSLIVYSGLVVSQRPPDGKFHYGYYRVESLAAVVAGIVMAFFAGVVLLRSYEDIVSQHAVTQPGPAMIAITIAAVSTLPLAAYKIYKGRKMGLPSFKAEAYNTLKDSLTSFIALGAVVLSYYGFGWADGVGGLIIGIFIIGVVYTTIRESSLVLVDACECSYEAGEIQGMAREVEGVQNVRSLKMRKSGPFLMGELIVETDGSVTLEEAHRIAKIIEETVEAAFPIIRDLTVNVVPAEVEGPRA